MIYALQENMIGRSIKNGPQGCGWRENICFALNATGVHAVTDNLLVRKLTPTECERLQGFPDGYACIPYRGKSIDQCPDSPRYKAIGNSWAVPVVRWIGQRIDKELNK